VASGSGSGSGDDVLMPLSTAPGPEPTSTRPTMGTAPDYTKPFISLTFTNLSMQQHEDFQEELLNLLLRLLELDFSPDLVIFQRNSTSMTSIVHIHFAAGSSRSLDTYANILSTSDDREWRALSSSYVSQSVSN
jgi:hypothetical protein